MVYRIRAFVSFAIALASASAAAQDQTIIVASPPSACTPVGVQAKATITVDDAPGVITTAIPGANPLAPDTSYIIHVMRYVDGQAVVDQSHWYVYNVEWGVKHKWTYWFYDPHIHSHFEDTRIYGYKSVALAYVHHNVPYVSRDAALSAMEDVQRTRYMVQPDLILGRAAAIDDTAYIEALKKAIADGRTGLGADAPPAATPAPVTIPDLQKTLAGVKAAQDAVTTVDALLRGEGSSTFNLIDSKTKQKLVRLSDNLLTTAAFANIGSISYQIAVTKKVPAPLQNLQDAAAIAFAQGGLTSVPVPLTATTSICGGRQFDIGYIPSDMVVTASTTDDQQKQKQLDKKTFDNESKYWWDISFALPLKSYNDLTYDTTNGVIIAKSTTKSNLFVVGNFSLPYDTKNARLELIPRLLYGMPISGQPLKHQLIGAAIGLNKIQLFAGVVFNQDAAPPTTTSGTVAESTSHTWSHSKVWGINLPVSAVAAALKPKK